NLYPNIDFYTGIIYKAMGFPTHMFTVLFAIGRLPGWIAQWQEAINDPDTKIMRPRQIYTGEAERAYVPIEERTGTSELLLHDLREELKAREKKAE
ncbi:MAG: citrate/2-methylcitrate synthase, partial [Dermabacter sp.]|nr:citrate/2-methylcitrate synthase [Dermabacter sp.]